MSQLITVQANYALSETGVLLNDSVIPTNFFINLKFSANNLKHEYWPKLSEYAKHVVAFLKN